MGDFNIDLLKFRTHETNDLLELMIGKGYLPLITKPTRVTEHSATLIDHIIYTNAINPNYDSGIILTIVADHFRIVYASRKKAREELSKYM